MKIELRNVTVRELVDGYSDTGEEGVRGYGGKLNIRPAYQREFIYKDKQREEVIHTARKGFPLNTMYWAKVGSSTPLTPSSFWFVNEEGVGGWRSGCQFLATDKRTPYTAVFDGSEANQTAHFIGRWMSTRNEPGPLSETVSATVPG